MSQLKNILDDNNITYTFPELQTESYQNDGKNEYYYAIDGYIDHCGELKSWLDDLFSDSDKLLRYLFGESIIITGNDNDDGCHDIMSNFNFDKYDVYEKWN